MAPLFGTGCFPVMLTPFKQDKSIDYPALEMLTEWYITSGSKGLFPVAQSGEMYELTAQERLETARFVKEKAAGRVPIIASGSFGESLEEMAAFINQMAEIVDAVVLLPSMLVKAEDEESLLKANMEKILSLTGEVPLGMYEVPVPYHRVVEPETLAWMASTGRFVFMKDTSRRNDLISAKIGAMPKDSSLGWYNGNCTTLLHSLTAGGDGFSGISMNYWPFLFPWLVANFKTEPEKAKKLQRFLTVAEGIAKQNYPASAKAFLKHQWGADVTAECRDKSVFPDSVPEEHEKQAALKGMLEDVCADLGIEIVAPPSVKR